MSFLGRFVRNLTLLSVSFFTEISQFVCCVGPYFLMASLSVVPIYFWPLIKNSKAGLSGSRPMAARGNARTVPGGVALDGERSFLDGGDFHGKCVCDPERCAKGLAVAIQVVLHACVSIAEYCLLMQTE